MRSLRLADGYVFDADAGSCLSGDLECSLERFERERYAVDAVAKSGRKWPIVEHMPKMPTAVAADHFFTQHTVTRVAVYVDGLVFQKLGQPEPESYFVPEWNSVLPHPAQWYSP